MNDRQTAKPLEAFGANNRTESSVLREGGQWETAQRSTTAPAQATTGPGDDGTVALWTAALCLCLRRYGAPETAGLTVLTCDRGGKITTSRRINLSFADTIRAGEWLDTARRFARDESALEVGELFAPEPGPMDGWRVALVLRSDFPPTDRDHFSSYERLFTVQSSSGSVCLSAGRQQTRLTDDWPLAQMLTHWEQLAKGLVEMPEEPVGRLPVLTPAEMDSLIHVYNKPAEAIVNPRFGFELFDDQVARAPDAPAVTEDGVTVGYRELRERSNRLAHYLRTLGVGAETIVGVFLERSIDLVVAVIGLQKAGGAYLPIDPGYPQGRLEYLISDSRVGFIITDTRLTGLLPTGDFRKVLVDAEADQIGAMDARPPVHGLKPGNMSAVFYTSGSTGQPKGVMMVHTAQRAMDPAKQKPQELGPGEKVLLKSAVGFTLILREIFWPLQVGGHLVVVPQDVEKDSAHLVRALRDEQVVGANFVPSMLASIMEEPALAECRALRLIYTVGESLNVELQRRLFRLLPEVRLFVFYGCTEAPSATFRECRPDEPYGNRVVIGRPMTNRKVYLLDRNLVPVPPGVAGEIHTGGLISRGYLHRPDLTADRFIPNPFSDQPGERLYRTGDLARRLHDGSFEFLGRADFQVQVRGIRVELGEIETAIAAHPAVKESLVMADPRHPEQTRLLAYYTERAGQWTPVAELRSLLRRQLPEYMMPSSFTRLEAFPLNANGKVDRRNLPEPNAAAARSDQETALPRTAEEVRLVAIWSRVLGVDTVGVTDSFFDLGGDSILVTRAVAQTNREFGATLSLPDFYRNPTIAAVAQLLFGEVAGTGLRLFLPISTGGTRRPVFMANTYPFLARYFGPEQPYYGMKHHWLDARFDYTQDVPAIARDYLREMREIQPDGPYVIVGFSMGGLFALEMARQLEETGQELDCLLLLDPTMPGDEVESAETEPAPTRAGRAAPAASVGWLGRHRARLHGLSIAEKFAYFWAWRGVPAHLFKKHCATPLKVGLGRGFNVLGWDVPFGLRRTVAGHYYQRISQVYRPQPLRSRAIVYLINRHTLACTAQFKRLFTAGLEVRVLATNRHLEVMREPYLSQWMGEFRQRLAGPEAAVAANEPRPGDDHVVEPTESADPRQFCITRNGEGQFSAWPVDWPLPAGWAPGDFRGDRKSCLAHVEQIWTDLRPASLR